MDLWEVIQERSGWCVYRNHRIMRYDCYGVEDALSEVKKRAGGGVTVHVYDAEDVHTTKVTKGPPR